MLVGHPGRSPKWPRHLPGCRLRSSGVPHEGYANPIMNDGPRLHSNVPVSDLTERVTRAIEASDVSSTPPIVETADRVMHETRLTPTEPNGARGLGPPDPDSGIQPTAQVVGGTNTGEHPDRQEHRSLRPQERVLRCSASDRLTSRP